MTGELHPLTSGIIVIAGIKPTNLSDEIRNHPRVTIWDSQNEHWTSKDLPSNTRAVFFGRWISHQSFGKIVKQAKARGITLFNTEGTGLITKQVRELLALNHSPAVMTEPIKMEEVKEKVPMATHFIPKNKNYGKLDPLKSLVDVNKGDADNARFLFEKSKELGITTTFKSLSQMCRKWRFEREGKTLKVYPRHRKTAKKHGPRVTYSDSQGANELDVAVQLLDNAIKELTDMRSFLVATVAENNRLKARMNKLKEMFE